MNFVMNKEMTVTRIKAEAKATMMEQLMTALQDLYGEENVKPVRTGNGSSKTNEIGVRAGVVDVNGETHEVCLTINASAKEFMNRKTDKRSYSAFDFDKSAEDYRTYMIDKNTKAADRAIAKARKIEADTAARKAKDENIEF